MGPQRQRCDLVMLEIEPGILIFTIPGSGRFARDCPELQKTMIIRFAERFNWKSLPPIPRQPWESGRRYCNYSLFDIISSFLLQISSSLCPANYQVSCAVGIGIYNNYILLC